MAVIRFEPFRDPFERLFSMAATGTRAPLGMPMDVYRAEDGSYHVEADLPGVDPDSVEVTVEHGILTIRAERTRTTARAIRSLSPSGPRGRSPASSPSARAWTRTPHRRLRRWGLARNHPRLAQDPAPPDRDHPFARRRRTISGSTAEPGEASGWRRLNIRPVRPTPAASASGVVP